MAGKVGTAAWKLRVRHQRTTSVLSTSSNAKYFGQQYKMAENPWQAKAAAKTASTRAKIAPEWRLSEADLEKVAKQRDLTGPFIQQYLDDDDLDVIQRDTLAIVAKLKTGEWSATRVTRAFCKTAAIAHQIASSLHNRDSLGYNSDLLAEQLSP